MILLSKEGGYFFQFDLLPLGYPHAGWHGYRLLIGRVGCPDISVLEATSEVELYLDREATPEVPMICDGIERVVDHGGSFTFSPVDERDFILTIEQRESSLLVSIDARNQPFSRILRWPDGVEVTASALRRFSQGLMLEFMQIMEGIPVDS